MQGESLYKKKDGRVVYSEAFQKNLFKSCYKNLLVGAKVPSYVVESVLSHKPSPPYFCFSGASSYLNRFLALALASSNVRTFEVQNTHYLVEVYVGKVEERSLSDMGSQFIVLIHGLVPTPNVRLLDLVCEFVEYRLLKRLPFLIVMVNTTDDKLKGMLSARGLEFYNFMDSAHTGAELI